jgi:hypothetical protein
VYGRSHRLSISGEYPIPCKIKICRNFTSHTVDAIISSEVLISDPISFKRVFIYASTMFVAIGSALMLYMNTDGSGMSDESESIVAAAERPLEPVYLRPPEPLHAVFYPTPASAPILLPAVLLEPQEPIAESLWPLTMSYHEAVANPAYYRAWLEAKNPGKHFRAIHAIVTGYCPCPICCGSHAHGITYTGVRTSIEPYGIAAPEALVRHAIHVPGYLFESEPGKFWKADDTGGALNTDWNDQHTYHFDVRFMSHDWAMRWWGYRTMTVYISQ